MQHLVQFDTGGGEGRRGFCKVGRIKLKESSLHLFQNLDRLEDLRLVCLHDVAVGDHFINDEVSFFKVKHDLAGQHATRAPTSSSHYKVSGGAEVAIADERQGTDHEGYVQRFRSSGLMSRRECE